MYFEIPGTRVRVVGTLHVFPPGAVGMPLWVGQAYDWCESLVNEHEVGAVLPFLMGDKPLQQVLKAETWRALTSALPSDQTRETFDSFHPWAAMIAISSVFMSHEPGVEPQLLARAAADGKPTLQLESGEELCSAFGSAPLDAVGDGINHALSHAGEAQERLQAMYDAWLTRDRAALLAVAEMSGMFKNPALREAGLVLRNRAWVSKVRQFMKSPQRTLVAVGAMHLCGPGNLEECLGVRLSPIGAAA